MSMRSYAEVDAGVYSWRVGLQCGEREREREREGGREARVATLGRATEGRLKQEEAFLVCSNLFCRLSFKMRCDCDSAL